MNSNEFMSKKTHLDSNVNARSIDSNDFVDDRSSDEDSEYSSAFSASESGEVHSESEIITGHRVSLAPVESPTGDVYIGTFNCSLFYTLHTPQVRRILHLVGVCPDDDSGNPTITIGGYELSSSHFSESEFVCATNPSLFVRNWNSTVAIKDTQVAEAPIGFSDKETFFYALLNNVAVTLSMTADIHKSWMEGKVPKEVQIGMGPIGSFDKCVWLASYLCAVVEYVRRMNPSIPDVLEVKDLSQYTIDLSIVPEESWLSYVGSFFSGWRTQTENLVDWFTNQTKAMIGWLFGSIVDVFRPFYDTVCDFIMQWLVVPSVQLGSAFTVKWLSKPSARSTADTRRFGTMGLVSIILLVVYALGVWMCWKLAKAILAYLRELTGVDASIDMHGRAVFLNVVPESAEDVIGLLSGCVTLFTGMNGHKLYNKIEQIARVANTGYRFGQAVNSHIAYLINCLPLTIRAALSWMSGTRSDEIKLNTEIFATRYNQLAVVAKNPDIANREEFRKAVSELFKWATPHYVRYAADKEATDFKNMYNRVRDMMSAQVSKYTFGDRPYITWFHFCGDAGVGKTIATDALLNLNKCKWKAYPTGTDDGRIYRRNIGDQFMTGYHNEAVIVEDEWCQIKDVTSINNNLLEILNYGSSIPIMLNMPDLAPGRAGQKGTTFSATVLVTANNDFSIPASGNLYEGVFRRRTAVVHVERNDQFADWEKYWDHNKNQWRDLTPELKKTGMHLQFRFIRPLRNRVDYDTLYITRGYEETARKLLEIQHKNYNQAVESMPDHLNGSALQRTLKEYGLDKPYFNLPDIENESGDPTPLKFKGNRAAKKIVPLNTKPAWAQCGPFTIDFARARVWVDVRFLNTVREDKERVKRDYVYKTKKFTTKASRFVDDVFLLKKLIMNYAKANHYEYVAIEDCFYAIIYAMLEQTELPEIYKAYPDSIYNPDAGYFKLASYMDCPPVKNRVKNDSLLPPVLPDALYEKDLAYLAAVDRVNKTSFFEDFYCVIRAKPDYLLYPQIKKFYFTRYDPTYKPIKRLGYPPYFSKDHEFVPGCLLPEATTPERLGSIANYHEIYTYYVYTLMSHHKLGIEPTDDEIVAERMLHEKMDLEFFRALSQHEFELYDGELYKNWYKKVSVDFCAELNVKPLDGPVSTYFSYKPTGQKIVKFNEQPDSSASNYDELKERRTTLSKDVYEPRPKHGKPIGIPKKFTELPVDSDTEKPVLSPDDTIPIPKINDTVADTSVVEGSEEGSAERERRFREMDFKDELQQAIDSGESVAEVMRRYRDLSPSPEGNMQASVAERVVETPVKQLPPLPDKPKSDTVVVDMPTALNVSPPCSPSEVFHSIHGTSESDGDVANTCQTNFTQWLSGTAVKRVDWKNFMYVGACSIPDVTSTLDLEESMRPLSYRFDGDKLYLSFANMNAFTHWLYHDNTHKPCGSYLTFTRSMCYLNTEKTLETALFIAPLYTLQIFPDRKFKEVNIELAQEREAITDGTFIRMIMTYFRFHDGLESSYSQRDLLVDGEILDQMKVFDKDNKLTCDEKDKEKTDELCSSVSRTRKIVYGVIIGIAVVCTGIAYYFKHKHDDDESSSDDGLGPISSEDFAEVAPEEMFVRPEGHFAPSLAYMARNTYVSRQDNDPNSDILHSDVLEADKKKFLKLRHAREKKTEHTPESLQTPYTLCDIIIDTDAFAPDITYMYRGICLHANYVLTFNHGLRFRFANLGLPSLPVTIRYSDGTVSHDVLTDDCFCSLTSKDITVVRLPKSPSKPSIVNLLCTRQDIENFWRKTNRLVELYCQPNSFVAEAVPMKLLHMAGVPCVYGVLKYHVQTAKGWCGCPVFTNSDHRLIGMHIAGDAEGSYTGLKSGYGQLLIREEVVTCLNLLLEVDRKRTLELNPKLPRQAESDEGLFPSTNIVLEDGDEVVIDGNTYTIGATKGDTSKGYYKQVASSELPVGPNVVEARYSSKDEVHFVPTKTAYKETIFAHDKTFGVTEYEPAILSKDDPRALAYGVDSPYTYTINQLAKKDHIKLNKNLLRRCVDEVTAHVKSEIDYSIGFDRELSIDEAIFGVPGLFNGMKSDSSVGFPSLRTWRTRQMMFGYNDDNTRYVNSDVIKRVNDYLQLFKSSEYTFSSDPAYVLAFIKDEPIKVSKNKEGRSRIIFACDCIKVIAWRMMFGSLLLLYNNKRGDSGIGMNQTSLDAHHLIYNYLNKARGDEREDYYIAGDYKSFDLLMQYEFQVAGYDVLYNLLPYVVDRKIWDRFVETQISPYVLIDDKCIRFKSSQFSGNIFTTICNNVVNRLMFTYIFESIYPALSFNKCVRAIFCGDDHILAVNRKLVDFNQLMIAKFMPTIGQKYTNDDKTTDFKEYKKFDEVTFMGCQMRLTTYGYIGALRKATLEYGLYWLATDVAEVVPQFLEYAACWDRNYYEWYCAKVRRVMNDQGYKVMVTPYSTMLYIMAYRSTMKGVGDCSDQWAVSSSVISNLIDCESGDSGAEIAKSVEPTAVMSITAKKTAPPVPPKPNAKEWAKMTKPLHPNGRWRQKNLRMKAHRDPRKRFVQKSNKPLRGKAKNHGRRGGKKPVPKTRHTGKSMAPKETKINYEQAVQKISRRVGRMLGHVEKDVDNPTTQALSQLQNTLSTLNDPKLQYSALNALKVALMFFDKPPMEDLSAYVPKFPPHSHCRGDTITTALQLHPMAMTRVGRAVMDPMQMDMEFLCGQEVFLQNFTWTTSNEMNTVVCSFRLASNPTGGYSCNIPADIVGQCQWWKGTLVFTFTLFKTVFHTGRLRAIIDYTNPTNSYTTSAKQRSATYSEVLDFSPENNSCEVRCPFVSLYPMIHPQFYTNVSEFTSFGNLVVEVANCLSVSSDTVCNQVECIVTYHIEDVELAVPNPFPWYNGGNVDAAVYQLKKSKTTIENEDGDIVDLAAPDEEPQETTNPPLIPAGLTGIPKDNQTIEDVLQNDFLIDNLVWDASSTRGSVLKSYTIPYDIIDLIRSAGGNAQTQKWDAFAYVRFNLKLRFQVNGNPLLQGMLRFVYAVYAQDWSGTDFTNVYSQTPSFPHVDISPQDSVDISYTIPFCYPLSYMRNKQISSNAYVPASLGIGFFQVWSPLMYASGSPVTIAVYASFDDLEGCIPMVPSNTTTIQDEGPDEDIDAGEETVEPSGLQEAQNPANLEEEMDGDDGLEVGEYFEFTIHNVLDLYRRYTLLPPSRFTIYGSGTSAITIKIPVTPSVFYLSTYYQAFCGSMHLRVYLSTDFVHSHPLVTFAPFDADFSYGSVLNPGHSSYDGSYYYQLSTKYCLNAPIEVTYPDSIYDNWIDVRVPYQFPFPYINPKNNIGTVFIRIDSVNVAAPTFSSNNVKVFASLGDDATFGIYRPTGGTLRMYTSTQNNAGGDAQFKAGPTNFS